MNGANCFAYHHIDPAGLKWQREDWRCRSSIGVQQTSRLSLCLRLSEEAHDWCLNGIKHVALHFSFIHGEGDGGGGIQGAPLEDHFDFVSLGAGLLLVVLSLRTRTSFMLLSEVNQLIENSLEEWQVVKFSLYIYYILYIFTFCICYSSRKLFMVKCITFWCKPGI